MRRTGDVRIETDSSSARRQERERERATRWVERKQHFHLLPGCRTHFSPVGPCRSAPGLPLPLQRQNAGIAGCHWPISGLEFAMHWRSATSKLLLMLNTISHAFACHERSGLRESCVLELYAIHVTLHFNLITRVRQRIPWLHSIPQAYCGGAPFSPPRRTKSPSLDHPRRIESVISW